MAAFETVSGFTTAAGATFTAPTFSQGTGTIRYFSTGNAYLITAWAGKQAAGNLRIRSPRLHDNVSGINLRTGPFTQGDNYPLLPIAINQRLVAQDVLTIESTGSAVAGDIENVNLLIYYDQLDSAKARLIDYAELQARTQNQMTLQHALVGGTAGVYGAAQTLAAAAAGTFKANTDYGLIGYTFTQSVGVTTTASTFGLVGVDTGNLVHGFPVITECDYEVTSQWFINLTRTLGVPAIPVINSANAGGTTLAVLNDENANTVTLTTIWCELS